MIEVYRLQLDKAEKKSSNTYQALVPMIEASPKSVISNTSKGERPLKIEAKGFD